MVDPAQATFIVCVKAVDRPAGLYLSLEEITLKGLAQTGQGAYRPSILRQGYHELGAIWWHSPRTTDPNTFSSQTRRSPKKNEMPDSGIHYTHRVQQGRACVS